MRRQNQLIMGIGHRIKSLQNPDMRVSIIKVRRRTTRRKKKRKKNKKEEQQQEERRRERRRKTPHIYVHLNIALIPSCCLLIFFFSYVTGVCTRSFPPYTTAELRHWSGKDHDHQEAKLDSQCWRRHCHSVCWLAARVRRVYHRGTNNMSEREIHIPLYE